MHYQHLAISQVAQRGYGCVESKSGIIITVGVAIVRTMELQDFLFSSEFHVKNKLKVDEINIEVRNRTALNLVGYASKVHQINTFWDLHLSIHY